MAKKSRKTTSKAVSRAAKTALKKSAKKVVKRSVKKAARKATVKRASPSAGSDPLVVAKSAVAELLEELDRLDPQGANPKIVNLRTKAEALDDALNCQASLTAPLAG